MTNKTINKSKSMKNKLQADDVQEEVTQPLNPTDRKNEIRKNFLFFLLIFCAISCMILFPMFYGIAWGAVFAFLWHPVHNAICRHKKLQGKPNLCAAISFALLLICCTIPLVFTLHAVVKELAQSYESFARYASNLRQTGFPPLDTLIPPSIANIVSPFLADQERITGMFTSLARSIANILQGLSKGILHWTGSLIFQGFVALITMFFLIRDGEGIVRYIKDFVPLPRDDRDKFLDDTGMMLKSVAYGVILTVGVQAVLGGIGWWASGLSNAFLAAAAMFIFGMFPMGTAVVWGPGAIYLMATGSIGWGVALFAWGTIVVASIDNILRPLFIGSGAQIPTFAIILGLTGGIAAWGLLGVFLGPLVLAMSLSILDLYRNQIREH